MSKKLKENNNKLNNYFKTKWWIIYLSMVLVIGSLLMSYNNHLVIYLTKDNPKPDTLQVFFPSNDLYDEKNSEKLETYEMYDGQVNVLKINLPWRNIDRVRIDPSNEAGNLIITKIEIQTLFSSRTLTAQNIFDLARPLQMIGRFEVVMSGLLIQSTSYDPFFELQIDKKSVFLEYLFVSIISAIISFIFLLFFKKISALESKEIRNKYYLLVIPLFISVGIATLFYPGMMSYDTLHAIRGARNGVTDSMWPPMVSYVWRVVDLISLNPSLMHFSQVFLLLGSIFYIMYFFTKKIKYATVFLFVYLSIPVILGTIAVIWKDVLMAAFFIVSFAVILYMKNVVNKKLFVFSALSALILIFLGTCSRHNAITGAVPLIFYLAFVVCQCKFSRPIHLWLGVILLGAAITGSVFFTKTLLDNYTLPSFAKLDNSTGDFIESVRVLDVAGASVCVGANLFAEMAPNLSLTDIKSLYEPKHINLSAGLLAKVGIDNRINKIWLNTAIHHPICFLNNKFLLTKYMLGANLGEQFLVTHDFIDENEYGYRLSNSSLRDTVMSYINYVSNLPFFRPWFIYLLSIIIFIWTLWVRILKTEYFVLYLSAVFYFGGLVVFGNAADARLLFYTTTALIMFILISILELWNKYRRNKLN
jgi:hypothetical protein